MNIEQAGFIPDALFVEPTRPAPADFKIAIIGAGMTGIDAAVRAIDRGFSWEIFDKEDGFGGLWWSARYPGVAVDTPSIYYSLSWSMTADWTKFYPSGGEYREYLQSIADTYDLAAHTSFGSEVVRLEWIEDDSEWELTIRSTKDGSERTTRASVVIGGAGHLNRPNYPNVPGRENFRGEQMHTAQYRSDVEIAGKRIGVIGVGAAGVQVVSSLAPQAAEMTVFQRQPVWLAPNTLGDGNVSDSERWLRRNLPFYIKWARLSTFAQINVATPISVRVDHEWMREHPDSISAANEFIRLSCLRYINETFGEGSELARKVTPDFPYGGKRPVRDPGDVAEGGYYWSLKQPHVHLETTAISRVVENGIETSDGVVHELDVIIWATGQTFDFMSPVQIIGRDGLTLREAWDDYLRPRTYLGGTIPGFPNFFMNDGPHTGVANGGGGHNFMTETVNHYAFETIQLLVESGASSVEVRQDTYDAHHQRVLELMTGTIWMNDTKANTYYRNSIGYVILPSPFPVDEFWTMSRGPLPEAFELRGATLADDAEAYSSVH